MKRFSTQLLQSATSLIFSCLNIFSADLDPSVLSVIKKYGLSRRGFYNLVGYGLKNKLGGILNAENLVKESIKSILLKSDTNMSMVEEVYRYLTMRKLSIINPQIEAAFGVKTIERLSKLIVVCTGVTSRDRIPVVISKLVENDVISFEHIKSMFNAFLESMPLDPDSTEKVNNAYQGKNWDTPGMTR